MFTALGKDCFRRIMEIKIGKSARGCHGCAVEFEHEQPLTSVIRIGKEGFVREDFCESCAQNEALVQGYSTWSAQYYDPNVANQEPHESFSPLRQSFYEAVELDTREGIAVAYLAAQLLRRQKVFRLIKEADDPDTEITLVLFSDRIGNRLIEVKDPSLTHAELDEARKQLMQRLSELENPEPEELQPEEGVEDGQSEDEYAQV